MLNFIFGKLFEICENLKYLLLVIYKCKSDNFQFQ